jgi:hypothetical protein
MFYILALHALALVGATTSDPSAQDAVQGFLFSYSSTNLNLPILPSCPGTLTIPPLGSLSSSEAADPQPPYTFTMLVHEQLMDGAGVRYERMYAKSVDVGSMQNGWSTSVPWMNGTQMIGCMSSGNGVSGGCQVRPPRLDESMQRRGRCRCGFKCKLGQGQSACGELLSIRTSSPW